MPISLTLSEKLLPAGAEAEAVARITAAFLRRHGLPQDGKMAANVTAHLNILPKGRAFAGGAPVEGAWVETKTPAFALADPAAQQGFFNDAIEILVELSQGALPRQRIWVNGLHAVDGAWSLDGEVMANRDILAALAG